MALRMLASLAAIAPVENTLLAQSLSTLADAVGPTTVARIANELAAFFPGDGGLGLPVTRPAPAQPQQSTPPFGGPVWLQTAWKWVTWRWAQPDSRHSQGGGRGAADGPSTPATPTTALAPVPSGGDSTTVVPQEPETEAFAALIEGCRSLLEVCVRYMAWRRGPASPIRDQVTELHDPVKRELLAALFV